MVDGFIYLGLPIGNDEYKFEFFEEKMRKIERSFYSLRGLGCKPECMNPRTIAFLYKQFSQSIIKYGFENIYLSESKIRFLKLLQTKRQTKLLNKKCVKTKLI